MRGNYILITTQNMISSVTYYLELLNAIIFFTVHFIFYQPWSNWLFGHNRTLTSSLGRRKKYIESIKI
jgi:hypothetical protein